MNPVIIAVVCVFILGLIMGFAIASEFQSIQEEKEEKLKEQIARDEMLSKIYDKIVKGDKE